MFLNRLNGEPIGFSVLSIFVIDKNTILTEKLVAFGSSSSLSSYADL